MKRCIAVVGALTLATGLGASASSAAAAAPAAASRPGPQAVSSARALLAAHPELVKGSSKDAFTATRTISGAKGTTHVRFQRTYAGLPVLGGDFVVHETSAGRSTVSSTQQRAIAVSTTPAVSAARAQSAARSAAVRDDASAGSASTPQLVVDARQGTPALAWLTTVTGVQADGQTPSRRATVVDAQTGTVRSSDEQVLAFRSTAEKAPKGDAAKGTKGVAAAGTGQSLFLGEVPLSTTQGGSGFEMTDPDRGSNTACDMNNTESSCDLFTDDDNAWGDGTNGDRATAAVDAYYGAAETWDYYAAHHDRSGIFGDGKGVPSRVHYGDNYVNAFWDGEQMTYGDGSGNAAPLVALDVAGHEMSHGVSEALAGLGYSGDVGGINEANSDIFGTMVEFEAGSSADPGDYDIGEKIDINGDGSPLRYMYEPSKDGASFDCWSSQVPASDPHYSSGVGNHFFFLLAEGSGDTQYGSSPTCDGSSVTGIGREKAAAIWYHALDAYMGSDETYAEARQHTVQAADELYGAGSAESQAVAAAWTAVAVG
ncbi:M4 family metallopeptidase [Angustibacter peucedani]